MKPNETGGQTLHQYDIHESLAALAANGQTRFAQKLLRRVEGTSPEQTLDISNRESIRLFIALQEAVSNRFYGRQNELMARSLVRQFRESGFKTPNRLQRIQVTIGRFIRN